MASTGHASTWLLGGFLASGLRYTTEYHSITQSNGFHTLVSIFGARWHTSLTGYVLSRCKCELLLVSRESVDPDGESVFTG